jgi:hypothetical protein
MNKKKIFNLEKQRQTENKPNHLRTEAKQLEESIKSLQLPNYSNLKVAKFDRCMLQSYCFFKNFFKKEIGKENNYIFNYKDNYLNDMSKIDKEFFKDFFKYPSHKENLKDIMRDHNLIDDRELIYEFAIYHPLKNTKTQQIAVLGSCLLLELRDKIYCVVDEIDTNASQNAFFFIENTFYNDLRGDLNNPLSR